MSALFDEPTLVMSSLAIALWLYWRGTTALWRQAGRGRGISFLRAGSFTLGLLVMAGAIVGPLAEAAHSTLTAHMVQHKLIMLASAPLIVIGRRPARALIWRAREEGRRMKDPSQTKWEGRWDQLRGKAKQTWGHLTDDDLDVADGNYEELVGRIKELTGETEERIKELLYRN